MEAEGGEGVSVVPRTIEANLDEIRRHMVSVSTLTWEDRELIRQSFDINTFFGLLNEFLGFVWAKVGDEEADGVNVLPEDLEELEGYLEKLILFASKGVFNATEGVKLKTCRDTVLFLKSRLQIADVVSR